MLSEDAAAVVCGSLAGSCMTFVGHPFDTAKVRMQTAPAHRYDGTLHCMRSTIAREGPLALYKGLPPAILTTCVTSGLRFGIQHRFNVWIARHLGGDSRRFESLSVGARVAAEGGGGAACGLVLPLVFTPMELIKCRRQVLADNSVSNLQIARHVLREHGLRGLYVGHRLTVLRSTLGNAAMFGAFEGFRHVLHSPSVGGGVGGVGGGVGGGGRRLGGLWRDSVAGVLAGWFANVVCFPFDTAKSRMQVAFGSADARGGPTHQPQMGIVSALSQLWREGSMYRGLSAMLVRAVPVHVVYLPCFGFLMGVVAPRASATGAAGRGVGDEVWGSSSRALRRRRSRGENV